MALIECTECGKKFSDKAVCCPECGCPTEEVLKSSNSAEIIAKRTQTKEQASTFILEEVKKAKSEARSAENLFDSRNSAIQRKTYRNIDLFGGDATARVVEIRADARRACDDLYTTYQSIIGTIDGLCRPLLQYEPSGEAIKAVRDLIRFLNDESEIESNFTASLNGSGLGNVANSKYFPSIENKMIQRFWETQYASSPQAIEYEKERRKAAEEARKKREIERKKAEEARRKEDERKRELGVQYKKHMDEVCAECEKNIDKYKTELNEEYLRRIETLSKQVEEHIEILKKQKEAMECEILKLGFFQMREKSEKKQMCELLASKILRLSDRRVVISEEEKLKQAMDQAIEKYKAQVDEYLLKRFPHKDEDVSPYEKYQEATRHATMLCPKPIDCVSVFKN